MAIEVISRASRRSTERQKSRSMFAASRRPLMNAPATVAGCSRLVASPAKYKLPTDRPKIFLLCQQKEIKNKRNVKKEMKYIKTLRGKRASEFGYHNLHQMSQCLCMNKSQ